MSGFLGLSSPWAREAIPPGPKRDELRDLVPDGWTVGLSVRGDHKLYTAWANNDETGEVRVHMVRSRDAEAAIRRCITWISGRYTSA